MSAIQLSDLSFSYGESREPILKEVNFYVNHGELVLLSGCSGAGKSTVLSLISGIIPHVTPGQISGQVLIDGEDMSGHSLCDVCRKVGVVLQNAESQIIQQLVEDELAFGCENFGFSTAQTATSATRSSAM